MRASLRSALPKRLISNAIPTGTRPSGVLPRQSSIVLSNAQDVVHPFFNVNNLDIGTLCITEEYPRLFDGKRIIPALVQAPFGAGKELKHIAFEFKSVKGIYRWLCEFNSKRALQNDKQLRFVNTQPFMVNYVEISDKADVEFFGTAEEVKELLLGTNASTGQLVLYLLQNFPEHAAIILEHTNTLIGSRLDDIGVLQSIVSQSLDVLSSRASDEDIKLHFFEMLRKIDMHFDVKHIFVFDERLVYTLLRFYADHGFLHKAKLVISAFIDRGLCPRAGTVERYLQLIDQSVDEEDPAMRRKTKFAFIADFGPLLRLVFTPKMLDILVEYCVHPTEVLDLLMLFEKCNGPMALNDTGLERIIGRLPYLCETSYDICASLSILLQKAENHYKETMPVELLKSFLNAYLKEGNYGVAAELCRKYGVIGGISLPEEVSNSSLAGFTEKDRQQFLLLIS